MAVTRSRSIGAVAALLLLAPVLNPVRAQQQTTGRPDGASTVAVASANILAGALTACVRALLTDSDVPRAALLGALGGGVNFAGKRIAAEPGAGPLLGRVVHAAGTSIVVQA
ncbi:MAG TPA: hypothetical protein VK864_08190, partial [Longimicrobiales bacterium]|nr:hypothetical protein [Longimicrobiales bacterium]